MKRIQKICWVFVITISVAVVLAAVAVTLLYCRYGWPKASAGLGFLGIAGIGGLAPLFFKKDSGKVTYDERDKLIKIRSAVAAFAMSYLFVGLACMIPFTVLGYKAKIDITWLPMIFGGSASVMFFIWSVAVLVQYGKGCKENE